MPTSSSALILFAHGARDPAWAVPVRRLQGKVAALRPDLAVEVAFLELDAPLLPEAIENLVAREYHRITIVPVFLAQGGHLKKDAPRLIETMKERFPGVTFDLWPALGDADPILDAISAWIVNRTAR
jgi:sirohydrochlorin cobaltochelatase